MDFIIQRLLAFSFLYVDGFWQKDFYSIIQNKWHRGRR
jgi:hypothetical protein